MPNWCATNFRLMGSREDIGRFCATVNSCLGKELHGHSDWGSYWLANIAKAFGYDPMKLDGLRGALDPDGDLMPSWGGGYGSPGPLVPDMEGDRADLSFSILTAWGPSHWFMEMLNDLFPDVEVAFASTDEFGNFHVCLNPEALGLDKYEIQPEGEDTEYFKKGQEDDLIRFLKELTGMDFTKEELTDEVFERLRGKKVRALAWEELSSWEEI